MSHLIVFFDYFTQVLLENIVVDFVEFTALEFRLDRLFQRWREVRIPEDFHVGFAVCVCLVFHRSFTIGLADHTTQP